MLVLLTHTHTHTLYLELFKYIEDHIILRHKIHMG